MSQVWKCFLGFLIEVCFLLVIKCYTLITLLVARANTSGTQTIPLKSAALLDIVTVNHDGVWREEIDKTKLITISYRIPPMSEAWHVGGFIPV